MRTIESLVTYKTGTFPNTLGVNSTGPSTKDGTELIANLFNDYIGVFPQALLSEMGIAPSGNAETAAISQQLDALKGLISRLGSGWGVIGRAAVDTIHDVTLSVGVVPDSTRAYMLRLTAEITKQIDAAWAAGDNAGGMFAGGSLTANTEYGMYLVYNPTTRATDAGFSVYTGAGVPTFLPAGFTVYQIVDWVKTDGSSQIIQTVTREIGSGQIKKHWVTPPLDINLANTLTTTRRTDAISVPTGFECMADLNIRVSDGTTFQRTYISSPSVTDQAPSATVSPLSSASSSATYPHEGRFSVLTSSARLIAARSDLATVDNYLVATLSFTVKIR